MIWEPSVCWLPTIFKVFFLSYCMFKSDWMWLGEEFRAVFWSTTEPLDSDGNTTNPTKSPCDPYIFNTVLTRSKSLVVVVGSPVALLGIEKHMNKHYGRKAECWSSYLKLCIKNRTFIIPQTMDVRARKSMLKLLQANLKMQLIDYSSSSTQPISQSKKSKLLASSSRL